MTELKSYSFIPAKFSPKPSDTTISKFVMRCCSHGIRTRVTWESGAGSSSLRAVLLSLSNPTARRAVATGLEMTRLLASNFVLVNQT
jgi:hypothetical protein